MKTIITIVFILISSVCYGHDSTSDEAKYTIEVDVKITKTTKKESGLIGKMNIKMSSEAKELSIAFIQAINDLDKLMYERR